MVTKFPDDDRFKIYTLYKNALMSRHLAQSQQETYESR